MELDSPATDGKASPRSAYADAYDKHAADAGIDENGDSLTDFDDDDDLPPDPDGEQDPDLPDGQQEPDADPDGPSPGEPNDPDGQPLAAQGDPPLLPPHTWPQEWKDHVMALAGGTPKEKQAAKILLDMNTHMNRGFTQRMAEIGSLRRDLGGVTEALRPHRERLQRAGISPDVAIQRSLAWDAHIQRNPEQGILDMAHAYGVDLQRTMTTRASEAQYLTPGERAAQQRLEEQGGVINKLQEEVGSFREYQQRQDLNARKSNADFVLQEFMNATDDQGNHLHPFTSYLAPAMAKLIQGGAAANLDEAYQIAEIRDPNVQQALRKQRQAQRIAEARRQADKARQASGGQIIGKTGGKPRKETSRDSRKVFGDAYDRAINAR